MSKQLSLYQTAYHEAGHAVVAWIRGTRLNVVSIVADDRSLGHTDFAPSPLSRSACWDHEDWEAFFYEDREPKLTMKQVKDNRETDIMITLAGIIAQRRFNRQICEHDDCGDRRRIEDIVKCYVTVNPSEAAVYVESLRVRVTQVLRENWHLVKALAELLIQRTSLTGEETSIFLQEQANPKIRRAKRKV